MRKYETIEVMHEEKILIKVICDFCQKVIKNLFNPSEGFGEITIKFGYPSKFDADLWRGEICDECFEKYFKNKIRFEYNVLTGEHRG